jgi:hypothetical protein
MMVGVMGDGLNELVCFGSSHQISTSVKKCVF